MLALLLRSLLLLLMLLCSSAAATEVYRWIDAAGNVHYGDRKPASTEVERISVRPQPPATSASAPEAESAMAQAARASTPPAIRMYLSPTCGYCTQAARFFDARGVPWRGEDITRSQVAKLAFERAGGRGTPLIIVDGQTIHGFQKATLERLLTQRGW
jgi:glutaredoxin 3